MGFARSDGGDHCTITGHACDSHIVSCAAASYCAGSSPGCAAEGHIAGGEIRDRLTEDHGEFDGRGIGWVSLPCRLVNGHRRHNVIVGHGVI